MNAPPFTTTTDAQGNITSVSYVGNYKQAAIPLSATNSVAASTSGDTNAGFAAMINNMIAVRDALTSGDSDPPCRPR